MIKCGHCYGKHETVADVRACAAEYRGALPGKAPGFPLEDDRPTTDQILILRDLLRTRVVPTGYARQLENYLARTDRPATEFGVATAIKRVSRMPEKVAQDQIPRPFAEVARELKAAHTPAPAPAAPVTQDGMYRLPDGTIFKVQYNRASGDGSRLYAKLLIVDTDPVRGKGGEIITPGKSHFEYFGSVRRAGIRAEHRLSLEEAKKYGAMYGTCCYGHPLTKESSIRKGIGPTCEAKYGMPAEG